MGGSQSKDGAANPESLHRLKELSKKASCVVALEHTGEFEAGSSIHGYVEIDVRHPKEILALLNPKDRYKYSYDDIEKLSQVHFNRIEVELVGEVNTKVRYKKAGHKKSSKVGDDSDDENDEGDYHQFRSEVDSGYIVDSSGVVIHKNTSSRHLASENMILYKENQLVAVNATSDLDHELGNLDSLFAAANAVEKKHPNQNFNQNKKKMKIIPDEILCAGKHRYPFTFNIPEFAPSTCSVIKSYAGDNSANIITRLVVHVQFKDDLDTTGLNYRLSVHSVPIVVRSRLPLDPAIDTCDTAVQQQHVAHAPLHDNVIYDANGVAQDDLGVTAPLHADIIRDSDDDDSSSCTTPKKIILQPPVINTQRIISKLFCCYPCSTGHITLLARSNKYSYCLDEGIHITWEIENSSSKRIKAIQIELLRKCKWTAQGHKYESELILAHLSRNDEDFGSSSKSARTTAAGTSDNFDDVQNAATITAPPSDPSSILCCGSIDTNILQVTYCVRITARVWSGQGNCCSYNPSVIVPIKMYSRFVNELNMGESTRMNRLSGIEGGMSIKNDNQNSSIEITENQHSNGRFDISNPKAISVYENAIGQYIRILGMSGAMNSFSHSGDNMIAPLYAPAPWEDLGL
jgi:hypothetical protein